MGLNEPLSSPKFKSINVFDSLLIKGFYWRVCDPQSDENENIQLSIQLNVFIR
jgi:hypothetical protein